MVEKQNIDKLLKLVESYDSKADLEMIRLAYDYAAEAHKGQTRKTGEPYIIHPLATAFILAEMRIDPIIICAALLHDVPEDTDRTLEDIKENFGSEIASLVEGITKLGKLKYRGVERYIENLRKMFVAMAEDIRVMIIKFADRIHNLQTLDVQPEQKRHRIALESLEIYAPIANRLGMGEMKGILEDLSFKYLNPIEYQRVVKLKEEKLRDKKILLSSIQKELYNELEKAHIKALSIHGREKKIYSLYRKLLEKNNDITKVYDIEAVRVIVPSIADCYASLGIIHKFWTPLKGRIKDYISQPKPNYYQSLHTTVFIDNGEIVEFQIRTPEMHDEAEFGVAAHWHYDETGSKIPKKDLRWAKELAEIQKDIFNHLSDLEEIKIDFLQSRIFVFTPKGDVIDLPEEATPVDLAYHIHTEIGNKCSGALVNENMTALNTKLKNGDVVEIITDKNRKGPSRDWLKFVKTQTARERINSAFKKQQESNIISWFKNSNKK